VIRQVIERVKRIYVPPGDRRRGAGRVQAGDSVNGAQPGRNARQYVQAHFDGGLAESWSNWPKICVGADWARRP